MAVHRQEQEQAKVWAETRAKRARGQGCLAAVSHINFIK